MKKIAIFSLLLVMSALLLGCTTNTPPQENDEEKLLEEIDSTWIEESELEMEEIISTESDAIAAETGNEIIEENEEIEIGEMV